MKKRYYLILPAFMIIVVGLATFNIILEFIVIINLVFFTLLNYFVWARPDKALEFSLKHLDFQQNEFHTHEAFISISKKIVASRFYLPYLRFCGILGLPLYIWIAFGMP